jgi:molybdopterin molybdotransferase
VLLISGGVSMGDYDLVPKVLTGLGVRRIFHNVKIKPGKPLFFGTKGTTLIFGIPGNPVSNFLTYQVLIRPTLLKMMGYPGHQPQFKEGVTTKDFRQKPGRKHFVLVKVNNKAGVYALTPIVSHGSADILALARADGFMVVSETAEEVKAATQLPFITWKEI